MSVKAAEFSLLRVNLDFFSNILWKNFGESLAVSVPREKKKQNGNRSTACSCRATSHWRRGASFPYNGQATKTCKRERIVPKIVIDHSGWCPVLDEPPEAAKTSLYWTEALVHLPIDLAYDESQLEPGEAPTNSSDN